MTVTAALTDSIAQLPAPDTPTMLDGLQQLAARNRRIDAGEECPVCASTWVREDECLTPMFQCMSCGCNWFDLRDAKPEPWLDDYQPEDVA